MLFGIFGATSAFSNEEAVAKFTCTDAWTLDGCSYTQRSADLTDVNPYGLEFSVDGTKMWYVGADSDDVFYSTLSTAWDLSTLTLEVDTKDVSNGGGNTHKTGFQWNDNGDQFTINDQESINGGIGSGARTVHEEWSCTTPYDIMSCSFSESYTLSEGNIMSTTVSPDGKTIIGMGSGVYQGTSGENLYRYDCSTGFDLTSCSQTGSAVNYSSTDSNFSWCLVNDSGDRMLCVGNANKNIHSYTMPQGNPNTIISATGLTANTSTPQHYTFTRETSSPSSITISEDYSSDAAWTASGSTITVKNGVAHADNSGSSLGHYTHRSLGTTLPDVWSVDFDYYNIGAVNLTPFGLVSGTGFVLTSGADSVNVAEDNPNGLYLSIYDGGTRTISPVQTNTKVTGMSTNTWYYVTVDRNGDDFTMKVFSDSARQTQFGSDVTLTVSGVENLTHLHHSGQNGGGGTNGLFFKVDNTAITYASAPINWKIYQNGAQVSFGSVATLDEDFTRFASDSTFDIAYVSQDHGRISGNSANDNIDATFVRDGSDDSMSYTLSSTLSDTWVLRYTYDMVSVGTGGNPQACVGLSSSDGNYNSNQDHVGLCHINTGGGANAHFKINGGTGSWDANLGSDVTNTDATTIQTNYIQITKSSPTAVNVCISSTDSFTCDRDNDDLTISSVGATLDEFRIVNNNSGSVGGSFVTTIDNVEIYDGVTTVIPTSTSVTDSTSLGGNSVVNTAFDGTNNGATTGQTGKLSNAWNFDGS